MKGKVNQKERGKGKERMSREDELTEGMIYQKERGKGRRGKGEKAK